MAQLLQREGYRAAQDPARASVLIVNTCGFIEPARQEALEVLRELARSKRPGQVLIAAGCLTQCYGREVAEQVAGIDGILGTRRWMDIVQVVRRLRGDGRPRPLYHLPEQAITVGRDEAGVLRASVNAASAYLKIADGCRRPCAFCAIPRIKGPAVSRPLETILEEARRLQEAGVRELILIAQDTTDYGYDLGLKDGLAILLERLVDEVVEAPSGEGDGRIEWIRLMYAYPGCVTERLMEVMATRQPVLPYLDMPLQHAHPQVLSRMKRPANLEWVYRTVEKMRAMLPRLAIRTTFLVGYPGEGEQEFEALLDFVRAMRFDRVGAFQFSLEVGTAAEALGDPIPPPVKQERYQRLMEVQQSISLSINQALVGQRLDVLIEGYAHGLSIGRSYRDAPEIDGLVLVEGKAPRGKIVPVQIRAAMPYDLAGVRVAG